MYQMIGYAGALLHAVEREQGAAMAGDVPWMAQQIGAAQRYISQLAFLLNAYPGLSVNLQDALQADGVRAAFTASDVSAFQSTLQSAGLPPVLVQALSNIGVDSATREQIRQRMISQSPAALAALGGGRFPDLLTDPSVTAAVQQLAQAFSGFGASFPRDTVAPTTAAQVTGTSGTNGWYTSSVSVVLNATDNAGGSGVKQLTYSADGDQTIMSTAVSGSRASVNITTEGTTTISAYAQDHAGSVERAKTVTVKVDKTAPKISASATAGGSAYTAGTWTNKDVIISFTCTDEGGSGVASKSEPVTISTEGKDQAVTGTCADNAGNTARTSFAISIDKTPPGITRSSRTPANANGWNNTDVAVTWSCTDSGAGSGVVAATVTKTVSSEGSNQSATGICTDQAGNTASDTQTGINIDKTAPALTLATNAASYTVDQTVSVTCTATDSLSTLASTTLSGVSSVRTCQSVSRPAYEFTVGTNTLSATASDKAGNSSNKTATFSVQVTAASLGNLTTQFVTNAGVASALTSQSNAIAAAPTAAAKAGALTAYKNAVEAQIGKTLTAEQAAILIRLAGAL